MYRTRQIRIKKGHRFYPYCGKICLSSARLYNRGVYLVRQYATADERLEKGKELTENQKEAYELIRNVTKGTKYLPRSRWLTYGQLDFVLKSTGDPAYRGLPSQANQQILKRIVRNFKSYFEGVKEYEKRPEVFTGRPHMPGYKERGSMVTAVLTNQICVIKEGKYLKFPETSERINVKLIETDIRLKEVRIKPHADSFLIDVVMEVKEAGDIYRENPLQGMKEKALLKHLTGLESNPYRVVSIDPGTDNFCALTNNFGERPFLIRGGVMKSENAYYNKKLAKYRSEAKKCNGRNHTRRIGRLHERRNRIIRDKMHKISRAVTEWAVRKDPIPAYRKGKKKPEMSGEQIRRGVYRHKDGTISNADINGAANIMRKVFPNVTEWDRGLVDRPYAVKIA